MNSARLKSQSQVNFESAHVNCDEGEKKGHKLAEILSLAVSCWKSRFIACIKLSSKSTLWVFQNTLRRLRKP